MILVACLLVLLALGLLERVVNARARRAVPIRIHVNGTRGKSTVTRLIAAALREAGIPTIAKVTGTAPRLILRDASEQPIARRAPASIREQLWLVRHAARAGARALVAECMAVRPDLQRVSEREMLRSTIGVITNVRADHTDVMGESPEEICASLANTIPHGGVLVLGDDRFAAALQPRCAERGTRMVVAASGTAPGGASSASTESAVCGPSWLDHDMAIALAVTREIGVDDEIALRGMRAAAPDPGAAACGVAMARGRAIAWLDATAANDPESLDLIAGETASAAVAPPAPGGAEAGSLLVYNHRSDRPDRLRVFARASHTVRHAAAIVLTGDPPSLSLVAGARRSCPHARVRFVRMDRLQAEIDAAPFARVIFCGNTRGFVRPFDSPVPFNRLAPGRPNE